MFNSVNSLEDVFPVADFIADSLGELAEVVVHDVRDFEASVVYIRNGHLSGRKLGDGTTDAALKMIKLGMHNNDPYVANYAGASLAGRQFRCSTYFIKDKDDKLIGLLCVNIDITEIGGFIKMLQILGAGKAGESEPAKPDNQTIVENLQGNPIDTVRRMISDTLETAGLEREALTRQQKMHIVEDLDNSGVFLMKGAVNVVASELNISVPTTYRYLQEIRRTS